MTGVGPKCQALNNMGKSNLWIVSPFNYIMSYIRIEIVETTTDLDESMRSIDVGKTTNNTCNFSSQTPAESCVCVCFVNCKKKAIV